MNRKRAGLSVSIETMRPGAGSTGRADQAIGPIVPPAAPPISAQTLLSRCCRTTWERARMNRIILGFGIFSCMMASVNGRNLGQWDTVNPEIREWYQALMQPDVPNASCCGEADAYWADDVHVRDCLLYT